MSDPNPTPRREGLGRPPLAVAIPILVLLALFGGWSAIWYEGSRRAEAQLGEWLERQAVAGRHYDCAERSVGGYPFRIELDCLGPTADIDDGGRRMRVSAARLHAVAMVWRPDHVIVGMDGPLRIEDPDRGGNPATVLEAQWSSLQSSLRAPGGRIVRIDLVVDDPRLSAEPGLVGPGAFNVATASRFEFHQRPGEGAEADADVALRADGLVLAYDDEPGTEAVDVTLLARLVGMPSPMPRDVAAFVAAWRGNAGSVEVVDLRAAQGDSVIRAEGRIEPDAQGRPEGTITVTLAGPDVATPGAAGAFGGVAPILAAALRLGGRTAEIDGRQGVAGDIKMDDGRVRFGPLPLARLPALF